METYVIEGGQPGRLEALMDFYVSDERETLPVPAYADLKEALRNQSLLVVTKDDGGFAATAGYFEHAASNDTHTIYELAGTRVKNSIGRLTGFSLQQILISLRVVQVAATEQGPVSLISSAKSTRSIDNLAKMGLAEIAPAPKWFEFDAYSWTRPAERSEWKHFAATLQTIEWSVGILQHIDFARGEFVCMASQKQSDGSTTERPIKLVYRMHWVRLFPLLAAAHRNGNLKNLFIPLPSSL